MTTEPTVTTAGTTGTSGPTTQSQGTTTRKVTTTAATSKTSVISQGTTTGHTRHGRMTTEATVTTLGTTGTSAPTTQSKFTTAFTSTPSTTGCPKNSTCLCENTCESLSRNPKGCAKDTCIDACKCPSGYKYNNKTGYCDYDIHCACVYNNRIYKVGDVIKKGECTQCICRATGFACGKKCLITHCPKGHELTYPPGKCCKCAPKKCKGGKTRVDCGCPLVCPTLRNTSSVICDQDHCQKSVCVCPDGKYDNGTACVTKKHCQCHVKGKDHKEGEVWNCGKCHVCKCEGGEVKRGKICLISQCPSGFDLVNPSGDRCCYCQPKTTELPTTTTTTETTSPIVTTERTTMGTTETTTTKSKTTELPTKITTTAETTSPIGTTEQTTMGTTETTTTKSTTEHTTPHETTKSTTEH